MLELLKPRLFLLLLFAILHVTEPANILFYQLSGNRSHKISTFPLAKELAKRGHNVTFVSGIEKLESVEGLKEIIPTVNFQISEDNLKTNTFMDRVNQKFLDGLIQGMPRLTETMCERGIASPEMQVLKSPETNGGSRFDIVIIDPAVGNECALGLVHLHDSILVNFPTCGFYPFGPSSTDNPSIVPYLAAFSVHYPDNTKFVDRLFSVLDIMGWQVFRFWYLFPKFNKLFEKYYGPGMPDIAEIDSRVAMTILNTHFAVDNPTPHTPSVIDLGCLHCKPGEEIKDKAIKSFIDDSGSNGFVFFSLGSIVSGKQVPMIYQRKILEALSKLKQHVIWKWEVDISPEELPKNVMVTKWAPQNDLLGHPKIRLFITHGGKLSTEETVYHGVPVIVVPIFGDQEHHGMLAEKRGYGKRFDLSQLMDGDTFYNTVAEVVDNQSFKSNALKFSAILRDNLNTPMETAVYWMEYLLRHEGAPHLQSNVKKFNYFQYYLIDVYLFLLTIVAIVILLIVVIVKFIVGKLCSSRTRKTKKE